MFSEVFASKSAVSAHFGFFLFYQEAHARFFHLFSVQLLGSLGEFEQDYQSEFNVGEQHRV